MEARQSKQTQIDVLPWIGSGIPVRTPGNEGQASSVIALTCGESAETKKARSVVALSRVPRLRAGCAGSPPAVSHGCKIKKSSSKFPCGDLAHLLREMRSSEEDMGLVDLGGCPASCPDTHRPTHDHRHVRNWARPEISRLTPVRNGYFASWQIICWQLAEPGRSNDCSTFRAAR